MNISRGLFLLLIFLLLALSIGMVLPFLQYILLSILLAYVFMPVQERLETRISPALAATTIVFVTVLVVIIPLVYLLRSAIIELTDLIQGIQAGEITLEQPEQRIQDVTGRDIDLTTQIQTIGEEAQAGDLVSFVDILGGLAVGLGLTVFLLYYFLKDGNKFAGWVHRIAPLPDDVLDRIYAEADQLMKAVLVGHVLIAIIQGGLAGIGLVVTGVPNPILWTVLMTVLGLLPIVGSFLIWGPAAIYLFLQSELVLGGFLIIWGVVVVGFSDDYLRPLVVDRYSKVNPSVIILGVLGGIFVFGVMGIFYGPIVFGLLRVTLEVFNEEMDPNEQLDLDK
jgi:predicted PurR-regulated permease PerM